MGDNATFQQRSTVKHVDVGVDGLLLQWQCKWAQVTCGAGLAIGVFLLWRRIAGGLQRPLEWPSLLVVGIALVATTTLIRRCWTGNDAVVARRLCPALILLSVGLAVSLPTTNGLALFTFWALLLVTESTFWCPWHADVLRWPVSFAGQVVAEGDVATDAANKRHNDERPELIEEPEPPIDLEPVAEEMMAPAADPQPAVELAEELPVGEGHVIQRLLRTRDAAGKEVLFGELRADFAPGDRHARLHVAFCPPLEHAPQVYAEATDIDRGLSDVAVKVAQVLPLGTRIDVELAQPAMEAGAVQVEFYAAVEL